MSYKTGWCREPDIYVGRSLSLRLTGKVTERDDGHSRCIANGGLCRVQGEYVPCNCECHTYPSGLDLRVAQGKLINLERTLSGKTSTSIPRGMFPGD